MFTESGGPLGHPPGVATGERQRTLPARLRVLYVVALLRTRRWIGFTLVGILAIVAFGLLSQWQWHRAIEKQDYQQQMVARAQQDPAPVESVVPPRGALATDREWTSVTATGTYLADDQVLVRKRPLNGSNGFWVAVPLRLTDGTALWVNRGWTSALGSARQVQEAPPPPPGVVTVTGRLRLPQEGPQTQPGDLPAGQVTDLDPQALSGDVPVVPAYLELVSSTPADGGELTALPLPEIDSARNLSYAGQWLIFALVAIIGWWFFLRREAAEDAAATAPREPVPADTPTP